MSPKQATDAQWCAKGFTTIEDTFARVLRDGPPPRIPAVAQRRLRALAQPRDYFATIVAGSLSKSLHDAPRITDRELEWIQKHYARDLLEGLQTVQRAIWTLTPRPVPMTAVPDELCSLIKAAFMLGADLERYHALMYQLSHAVRGAKNLAGTEVANEEKTKKARERAHGWLQEVEARQHGSREAAYARIERRERRKPGTVKKALIRLRKRASRP